MVMTDTTVGELLEAGTHVDVRSTLDQRWSSGFVVIEAGPAGYRLRRTSDGSELPGWVPVDQIRRERKRNTWWM